MNSVIQKHKECFACLITTGLEEHHCLYGFDGDRALSEQYGLKVWLCHRHHRDSKYGVHFGNKELDKSLKELAQRCFMLEYPHLDFMQIFGRNYIDENEVKEKAKEWAKAHKQKKKSAFRYPSTKR